MKSPAPPMAGEPILGPARTIIAVAGFDVLLNGGLALVGRNCSASVRKPCPFSCIGGGASVVCG